METNKNILHPTFLRILKRAGLNAHSNPKSIEEWNDFISRINNFFYNFDQERYLLERSMDISSRELFQLNKQLEDAAAIAHIGYWIYTSDNKFIWSHELYNIIGWNINEITPSINTLLDIVHKDDISKLTDIFFEILKKNKSHAVECRIYRKSDKALRWVYIKAQLDTQNNMKQPLHNISGIIRDITEKKQAQIEIEKINKELIVLSKKAGMSEIAISMLHNIGNILNSVNTSLSVIQGVISNISTHNLSEIGNIIKENLARNGCDGADDKKAKLIPDYLTAFSDNTEKNLKIIKKEIAALNNNMLHIKDIISRQNITPNYLGVSEKVALSELCDLAINMSDIANAEYAITITRDYIYPDILTTDKTKLLQIIINLLTNTIDALVQKGNNYDRHCVIKITNNTHNKIKSFNIIVQDNGIGITKDNLDKSFLMGFTTKQNGHGYGLHSCALAAKELNGSLLVESDGPKKGAKFILSITDLT